MIRKYDLNVKGWECCGIAWHTNIHIYIVPVASPRSMKVKNRAACCRCPMGRRAPVHIHIRTGAVSAELAHIPTSFKFCLKNHPLPSPSPLRIHPILQVKSRFPAQSLLVYSTGSIANSSYQTILCRPAICTSSRLHIKYDASQRTHGLLSIADRLSLLSLIHEQRFMVY
jgi:hypothetical protein